MKKSLYVIGIVAITTVAMVGVCSLTSCSDDEPSEASKIAEYIVGTFHYETRTRIYLNNPTDTIFEDFINSPDGHQYYDVYGPDGRLVVYETQNKNLLFVRKYNYIVRNDSIFSENEETKLNVHVVEANDSILRFESTRVQDGTPYLLKTRSRRCNLPEWLKKQIGEQ